MRNFEVEVEVDDGEVDGCMKKFSLLSNLLVTGDVTKTATQSPFRKRTFEHLLIIADYGRQVSSLYID
jgi:hypothetical protein